MSNVLEVTTESGSVYRIDTEAGFWTKNGGPPERLWDLQVGDTLAWPWNCPTGWSRAKEPEVGKNMYIASRDVQFVSTKVAEIVLTDHQRMEYFDEDER